jgi:hypothetical protein
MKHILATLLLIAVMASAAQAQERVYRYEKGKEYKYILEETTMTLQEVQGQTMTSNIEALISNILSIEDVDAQGNITATTKIDNALVIIESGDNTQTLGGDLAGKSVSYTFDHLGKVLSVDTALLREMDNQAAQYLKQTTSTLPKLNAEKLSVGSSWKTSRIDTSGQGESRMITKTNSSYSVKGKKKVKSFECLEIAVESKSDISGKMVRGDQEMTIKGDRNSKGFIYYAPAQGLLVEVSTETTGDQVIVLSGMNMRIPVSTSATSKLELASK